jgi:hypothetical protein
MADRDDAKVGVVWVRTTPGPGLSYRVTLEIDDDTAADVDDVGALVHVRAVGASVARARHDAVVVAQLRHLTRDDPAPESSQQLVVETVTALRERRKPIVWPTPLTLEPGVSAFTGKAFLTVVIRGKRVGQWTLADARTHIGHVFECLEGARLDEAYLTLLATRFGLDEATARAAVVDLASFDLPEERTGS